MTPQLDFAPASSSGQPAERHELDRFASRDPAATQAHLTDLFGPHVMELPEGARGFEAYQYGSEVSSVAVHRVTYGAVAVDVRPEPLADRVLVVQPLRGLVGVSSGAVGVVASAQLPAVLDAGKRYRVHWSKHSVVRKVSFDRAMVTEVAAELRGVPVGQVNVEFGQNTPASARAVTAWSRIADLVSGQLAGGGADAFGPLARSQLAKAAVATLLDAYPDAMRTRYAEQRPGWVAPRGVERAVRYIEQNAQDPVRLHDIAHDAGLSPRALQVAFRRYHDVTPMAFLRSVRVRRAYAELVAADPEATTVAAVAAKWGFFNPGRFASECRAAFGRYPRDVLSQR